MEFISRKLWKKWYWTLVGKVLKNKGRYGKNWQDTKGGQRAVKRTASRLMTGIFKTKRKNALLWVVAGRLIPITNKQ